MKNYKRNQFILCINAFFANHEQAKALDDTEIFNQIIDKNNLRLEDLEDVVFFLRLISASKKLDQETIQQALFLT